MENMNTEYVLNLLRLLNEGIQRYKDSDWRKFNPNFLILDMDTLNHSFFSNPIIETRRMIRKLLSDLGFGELSVDEVLRHRGWLPSPNTFKKELFHERYKNFKDGSWIEDNDKGEITLEVLQNIRDNK